MGPAAGLCASLTSPPPAQGARAHARGSPMWSAGHFANGVQRVPLPPPPSPSCPTACFSLCFARLGHARPLLPLGSPVAPATGASQAATLFPPAAGTHPAAVHAPPPHPADFACAASAVGPPHLGAPSFHPPPPHVPPPIFPPRPGPNHPPTVCRGSVLGLALVGVRRSGLAGGLTTRSQPQTALAGDLPRGDRLAQPVFAFFQPRRRPLAKAYPLGGPCPRASQVLARAQAGRDP